MTGFTPTRCCRSCEYWDGGGEIAAKTALSGDCLNSRSDRFTPEWDHVCPAFYPATAFIIDASDMECTVCGTSARIGCKCWTPCPCGWLIRAGEACRNPAHARSTT